MLVAYDGEKGLVIRVAVVNGTANASPEIEDAIMALHERLLEDLER
jgi:hypothetical protein